MSWFERLANKKMYNYDGSHDITHASRVAKNVQHIVNVLDEEEYRDCAMICAWLHDVCDKKYTDPEVAIKCVKRECRRHKFDHFDLIANVIVNISYTRLRSHGPPVRLDANTFRVWSIVAQADMLEALGVTGIIRTLMYQGSILQDDLSRALAYAETTLLDCSRYIDICPTMCLEASLRRDTMRDWIKSVDTCASVRCASAQFVKFGMQRESFTTAAVFLRAQRSVETTHFFERLCDEAAFAC